MKAPDVTIAPVGDSAAIAILGERIDPAVIRRVWALCALTLQRFGDRVLDVVPAYASVLVRFDPAKIALAHVMAGLRGAARDCGDSPLLAPRRIRVGACFGGEFGADLEETAAACGFAPARFIAAFCRAEYRVAFLGFLAGFPYLVGLPAKLAVPRRPAPRDRVAAGSVAIAGAQCGIYPRASPGGWRLIGRTNAPVFDPARDPAALFAPGDVVRFEPVERLERATAAIAKRPSGKPCSSVTESAGAVEFIRPEAAWRKASARALRILSAGALSTVQDCGREGVGRLGVSPSGAADWFSARAANRLAGNDECAALIETTMTGASFEILAGGLIAVTGAAAPLTINDTAAAAWRSHAAPAGARIVIGAAEHGLRSYLSVRGGIDVPLALGSASTDLGAGFGGCGGRALRAGDTLAIGSPAGATPAPSAYSPESIPRWTATTMLRVLWGPHREMLPKVAIEALLGRSFVVSSRSTRQGVQLDGEPLDIGTATDVVSAGACAGCVQITSAGLPVLLLAEHQTTGGYASAACVIAADMPRAAQLRPGGRVRFEQVSQVDAAHALTSLKRVLETTRADLDPRLGGGFYEGW